MCEYIKSSDLPKLSNEIKLMINKGLLPFFSIRHKINNKYQYVMKIDNEFWLIDAKGNPLRSDGEFTLKNDVYFKDVPFPPNVNTIYNNDF